MTGYVAISGGERRPLIHMINLCVRREAHVERSDGQETLYCTGDGRLWLAPTGNDELWRATATEVEYKGR